MTPSDDTTQPRTDDVQAESLDVAALEADLIYAQVILGRQEQLKEIGKTVEDPVVDVAVFREKVPEVLVRLAIAMKDAPRHLALIRKTGRQDLATSFETVRDQLAMYLPTLAGHPIVQRLVAAEEQDDSEVGKGSRSPWLAAWNVITRIQSADMLLVEGEGRIPLIRVGLLTKADKLVLDHAGGIGDMAFLAQGYLKVVRDMVRIVATQESTRVAAEQTNILPRRLDIMAEMMAEIRNKLAGLDRGDATLAAGPR